VIFTGFMFYRVPAGLCVYLIASSLWGMGERKLLDLQKSKLDTNPPAPVEPETGEGRRKYLESKQGDKQKPERQGLWAKLIASAEAAADQSKTNAKPRSDRDGKNKKKKSRR
jgi:YidC/Oxa1 family membrane protein insertase